VNSLPVSLISRYPIKRFLASIPISLYLLTTSLQTYWIDWP
jgi:hypothetical protein